MEVSVVITTKNEEETIVPLLDSLFSQTRQPDEVVIVDGGSKDSTVEKLNIYKNKEDKLRIIEKFGSSRAEGRNIGVKKADNDIIAITDAGAVPKKDWLEKITQPFNDPEIDIVAGFYEMTGDTPIQKAAAVFLGVLPENFDENFLPSARSMAIRRRIWNQVEGFPENLDDTAEDTVFNYNAVSEGAKFARVKDARVEWELPSNPIAIWKKIYRYARGDAKSRIIWHPSKKQASHNIKAILVFVRYLIGLVLLRLASIGFEGFMVFFLAFLAYSGYAFWKVYRRIRDPRTALAGVILQYMSDFAVMFGFLDGIVQS